MKNKSLLTIFSLLLFAQLQLHSQADGTEILPRNATLCHDFEEVYMSCLISNKVVSVCASGNISPRNGYVKYRFGTLGNIELEYPNKSIPPDDLFLIKVVNAGNNQETSLIFYNGIYSYELRRDARMRLIVEKNKKVISKLVCDEGQYQDFSPRMYRGIKAKQPGNTNQD
jgi:hypothetical protein